MIGEPVKPEKVSGSKKTKTIDSLIRRSAVQLAQAGIENSLNESRLLLEAATGIGLKEQLVRPDRNLNDNQVQVFNKYIELRRERTPFAYITGQREFYGRTFQVENCLIPRPETELLIELVLNNKNKWFSANPRILELCTGTGCLGITLYLELKTEFAEPDILLTDISQEAIATCKANIGQYCESGSKIDAVIADLFPEPQKYDLIIANPPYVKREDIEQLESDIFEYEPHLALDGGSDGLDFYRRIANEINPFLSETGSTVLILEHGTGQREAIKQIIAETNLKTEKIIEIDDYQKLDRVLGFIIE
ncbi:MAG TPA: peptide chain release factor N(5)-glutamine methyltransferase [Clostridiaceae bacterium]|nr:peptide chain release factor N(5)-glutamine methyltransferase [Clostridiaceae bacterium]